MGDVRYAAHYARIKHAKDPVSALRALSDDEVISALAAASAEHDPYLANVLATEAQNRARQKAAILSSLDEGVLVTDMRGILSCVNAAASRMLGWPQNVLIGESFHGTVHDEHGDDGEGCPMLRAFATGEPQEAAGDTFRRFDGTAMRVTYTASPILRDEMVEGVVIVFQDIERIETLERREAEVERRALFERIPTMSFSVGTDLRIISVNRYGANYLGYEPQELVSRPVVDIFHPDDRPRVRAAIRDFLANPLEVLHLDARKVRKDGSVLWVRESVSELPQQGDSRTLLLFCEDVTESREAEAAIRDLADTLERRVRERTNQLAAANRDLESFSYSVSHDLRAPLRGIDYFSQVLEQEHGEALGDEGRAHVERIRTEVDRMTHLIHDILELSQVGRREVDREDVDVTDMARSIGDALRRADPSRDVTFDIPEGLHATADPDLLRVVLENLIGNAWKYTRRKPHAHIEVGAKQEAGRNVYYVSDNGAGFDMTRADRLFQPFQRLHSPSEYEGTGIGLATVSRIIQRHGGRIWAEGEVDEGATFYFTLGE